MATSRKRWYRIYDIESQNSFAELEATSAKDALRQFEEEVGEPLLPTIRAELMYDDDDGQKVKANAMQRITEADKKVIRVFLRGGKADGNKLWADGRTLNGHWLGGSRIAYWEGSGPRLLNLPDTGSKTGEMIQRAVRRMFQEMTPNAKRTKGRQRVVIPAYLQTVYKHYAKHGVPAHLKRAYDFFYDNAGYGYDPKHETKEQGHRRSALALAVGEQEATQRGWSVTWEEDPEPYQMGDAGDGDAGRSLRAVLRDQNGKVLESLWGIGDPDPKYRRVVEAELALEALL